MSRRTLEQLRGKQKRVTIGKGLPNSSEGTEGEIQLRETPKGLMLFAKYRNQWHSTPLVVSPLSDKHLRTIIDTSLDGIYEGELSLDNDGNLNYKPSKTSPNKQVVESEGTYKNLRAKGTTKDDVKLGEVENTKLSTWSGSSNITTLGTVGTGTWSGDIISKAKGGFGEDASSLSSSIAELNKLDGFTGTADDLNYAKDLRDSGVTISELDTLDGYTGGATELNYAKDLYDTGVTSTEFDKLDGLTATTNELNIMDGVTASTSELNVMDGITSTTGELNKLDGFTGTYEDLNYAKDLKATDVTSTEFDYLDGVTSNIQTQMDAKLTTANLSGSGVNVVNSKYSSFRETTLSLPANATSATVTRDTTAGDFVIGDASVKIVASGADAWCYLASSATDYNFNIAPNKKWIVSGYVQASAATKQFQIYIRTSASGTHYNLLGNTSGSADTWTRVSGVLDLSSDASTTANMRVDNDGGSGVSMWFDGLMLEEQIGTGTTPSTYVEPAGVVSNDLDASDITTGTIDNARISLDAAEIPNLSADKITTDSFHLDRIPSITNAKLAGSIANSKLVNDSISLGGVSVDLGGSDATPAFDLQDSTNTNLASIKSGTQITTAQIDVSANVKTLLDNANLADFITDLNLSSSNISDVDAFSQSGNYSGLRAQSTTKGDVGLGNVSNDAQLPLAGGTMTGDITFGTADSKIIAKQDLIIKLDKDTEGTHDLIIQKSNGDEVFKIDELGDVNLGEWKGTAIADSYISSAVAWNAKLDKSGTIADNDFAKFSSGDLVGRSYSETKSDLSLGNVEDTALSTWAGTSNITTVGNIGTGTWSGDVIAEAKGGTGVTSTTTIGKALLGIADVSAESFLRINANETITVRSAADFRGDIGAGTSSLALGTTGSTALAGDTNVLKWDGGSSGLVAGTGRTSLGLGTAATKDTGTGSSNVILGDDSRLTDARECDNTFSSAGTARSNLGGTTIGQNLFTLTNPGAISYLKIAADNTVTARSASDFRGDIGAGTSSLALGTTGSTALAGDTNVLKWDGGSTGLTASTGRASLGGTTTGQALFTLADGSGSRFIRIDDDDGVTVRTASNFRSDIGAGTSDLAVGSGSGDAMAGNTTVTNWDGGSTGLTASTGRTSLGGTTVGQNIFTLSNPGAVRFIKIAADNTVSTRSAANFRSDIGAGTSSFDGAYSSLSSIPSTFAPIVGTNSDEALAGNTTVTNWSGGSSGLTASTGRDSLGGTTVGQNLFTLSNPGAVRFIRLNADNSVTAQSDADFKTALTLNNVDNTSDSSKPVSTAQQSALDDKANAANPSFSFTGSEDAFGVVGASMTASVAGHSTMAKFEQTFNAPLVGSKYNHTLCSFNAITAGSGLNDFTDVRLIEARLDGNRVFSVNTDGDIVTSGNITGLAGKVEAVANNSNDETVYPTFVDGATGTQDIETDTGLTYNPSSGILTSTAFAGNLTGNAATATEATNVTVSANNTADETVYPLFVDGATGTQGAETDSSLTYNPSSGQLTSSIFAGDIKVGGHTFDDIDIAGEFTDADSHIMSSAAIQDKIQSSLPSYNWTFTTGGYARATNTSSEYMCSYKGDETWANTWSTSSLGGGAPILTAADRQAAEWIAPGSGKITRLGVAVRNVTNTNNLEFKIYVVDLTDGSIEESDTQDVTVSASNSNSTLFTDLDMDFSQNEAIFVTVRMSSGSGTTTFYFSCTVSGEF